MEAGSLIRKEAIKPLSAKRIAKQLYILTINLDYLDKKKGKGVMWRTAFRLPHKTMLDFQVAKE